MNKRVNRVAGVLLGAMTAMGGVVFAQTPEPSPAVPEPGQHSEAESTPPASTTASKSPPGMPTTPAGEAAGTNTSTATAGNNSTEMAPIIVTGSLIPTQADEVGPTEVAYVTDSQIKASNSNNLFDALKRIDTSFTGGSNFGQETNNNSTSAGESHLAIRNLETLVLIDGNRLTNSPLSQGSAVDVNLIPLSFIDHVEVLKDGASTIYGADAVGGVVNIITKKNFTGAEVDNQYGFTTDKGDYFSDTASIIGGSSTADTNFFGGFEYHYNNQIYSKDRAIASQSYNDLTARGAIPQSYFSGTAPGVIQDVPNAEGGTLPGRYILSGSPFAKGAATGETVDGFTFTTGYNPAITTPIVGLGPLAGTDAQREAQLAAYGYIPLSAIPSDNPFSTFLNTTQFGTYSYTPQTSEKAFANFDHQFYPKTADFYAQLLYTHTDNQANLAPQPIPNIATNITVPANNPYNPFGVPIGLAGTDSTVERYRTLDVGNRDYEQENNYYHFVTGVKGDFGLFNSGDSDYHYDLSFGYDREESNYTTANSINGGALQEAVTPSATNPFVNALGTPTYDVFGIATNNSAATSRAISAILFNDGIAQLYEVNGHISGTPFTLPGGPFGFALGGEERVEELEIRDDGVTQSGEAVGVNPTASFALQKRTTYAGYAEFDIPIIGPDMKIPGIDSFVVNASSRIEEIKEGVNAYVSRVNGTWLPLPSHELSLRANFSQSFIVPTLYSEFGPPTVSSNDVSLVDGTSQQFISEETSPNIPNITAQNFGGGFTYSPKFAPGLTVSADYYNVQESGGVAYAPYQPEVDSLEAQGSASPYAGSFVFANGSHLTTTAVNQINAGNFGTLTELPVVAPTTQKTSGIDATVTYVLPWKQWGTVTVGAVATYLINYNDQNGVPGGVYTSRAGTFTDPEDSGGFGQGLLPKWQVNPYLEYDWGGFTYNVSAEYIPGGRDLGDSESEGGFDDYTLDGNPSPIEDYYRLDMQMAYEWGKPGTPGLPFLTEVPTADAKDMKEMKTGKDALTTATSTDWFDGLRVAVGVNNVTNVAPPFLTSSAEDNTDKATYDIIGRFVYFQIDKKF